MQKELAFDFFRQRGIHQSLFLKRCFSILYIIKNGNNVNRKYGDYWTNFCHLPTISVLNMEVGSMKKVLCPVCKQSIPVDENAIGFHCPTCKTQFEVTTQNGKKVMKKLSSPQQVHSPAPPSRKQKQQELSTPFLILLASIPLLFLLTIGFIWMTASKDHPQQAAATSTAEGIAVVSTPTEELNVVGEPIVEPSVEPTIIPELVINPHTTVTKPVTFSDMTDILMDKYGFICQNLTQYRGQCGLFFLLDEYYLIDFSNLGNEALRTIQVTVKHKNGQPFNMESDLELLGYLASMPYLPGDTPSEITRWITQSIIDLNNVRRELTFEWDGYEFRMNTYSEQGVGYFEMVFPKVENAPALSEPVTSSG